MHALPFASTPVPLDQNILSITVFYTALPGEVVLAPKLTHTSKTPHTHSRRCSRQMMGRQDVEHQQAKPVLLLQAKTQRYAQHFR